jgi:hypothetical protein
MKLANASQNEQKVDIYNHDLGNYLGIVEKLDFILTALAPVSGIWEDAQTLTREEAACPHPTKKYSGAVMTDCASMPEYTKANPKGRRRYSASTV